MPTGNIPGWRQTFAESFDERSLDMSRWRVYSGALGGDSAGWFDPHHVELSDGMLVISAYRDQADGGRWATGGISSAPSFVQTYGKYLVRFRLGAGDGIGHTLLLVRPDGSWPPEVDFSEDNGSGRNNTLATLHYGVRDHKIFRRLHVYLTEWHTLGVQWAPGELQYTIDGRIWTTVHSSGVPSVPMAVAMQTQTWPCVGTWGVCPDASTPRVVRMYVDWVVGYAPATQ